MADLVPLQEDSRPLSRLPDSDALTTVGPTADRPLALAGDLPAQIRLVRELSAVRPGTVTRRMLFMWLRIFVDERKPGGKRERVNVRIPLPIPLLGLLLPYKMSSGAALAALTTAHAAPDGPSALQRALNAHMPFEFVHVEETNDRSGKETLVVIGLE